MSQNKILNIEIKEETHIRVGSPADKPESVIDDLSLFFETSPDVISARLSLIQLFLPEQEPIFSYVISIETKNEAVIQESKLIAVKSKAGRWPLVINTLSKNKKLYTENAIIFYRAKNS